MLRFDILASVLPLAVAGGLWSDWTERTARPCIAAGMTTVQIASAPTQFARQVAFTDDPTAATVRVQIVDRPELADLTIVDGPNAASDGCAIDDMTRLVAIGQGIPGEPLVYLSREADADYRIFVVSDRTSLQQAAALIVAARGGHRRMTASAP